MNHKKPTQEELDAKIAEVASIPEEELDKVEPESFGESKEDPEVVEPVEVVEEVVETPEVVEPEAEPSAEIKEALKKEVEAKKKEISASARENQKILAKNRVLNQAIAEASQIPEPTEEELQTEFADWDVMSDVEKHMAKETVISKNFRKLVSEAQDKATKIEKWNEEVEKFATDPTTLANNPELEGKQEEFIKYSQDESKNSVPFSILVPAFLHEHQNTIKSNKGAMFATTTAPKETVTTTKISIEDARVLRETDYAEWKKQLNLGNIESEF